MAQGSRFIVCQRAVGEHPLPGYGSVALGNRLVRTRMLGGVGAGGEKPPATRFVLLSQLSCNIDPVTNVGFVSFVKINFVSFGGHNRTCFFTVAVSA